ncbi:MAG: hypothetical protein O3C21_03380 [Verrucomicrobia bacterium]|nr:hypothetical protein [Verrucomicrobiota bacterium]
MKQRQLDAAARELSLIDSIRVEYLDGVDTKVLDSPVESLPNYRHASDGGKTTADSWQMLINGEPVEWTLRLERIPNSVELASDVTITAEDMKIFLDVSYPASQPEFVWDSELREIVLGTTKVDRSALGVDRMEHALASQSTLQTRTFEDDGVRIETKFYCLRRQWASPPVTQRPSSSGKAL